MNHGSRNHGLSIVTSGILLLGLPSCTSGLLSNPEGNKPISNQSVIQEPNETQGQSDSRFQAIVKIAPSSSSQQLLQILADTYQIKNKSVKVEMLSSSQSGGAIAAFKNHIADIAGCTHKPNPKEDNGQMQYRDLAKDLLLVATHASVKGVSNLTTEQLQAIYSGEVTTWNQIGGPNAAIVVLDRPEDESAKKLLRKYYLGQSKTTSNAVVLNQEPELIQTLQDTPHTIGPLSLAYAQVNQLPINHLSLNGVSPTIQHFAQGKYPMARQIGIVWDKTPPSPTQDFVKFIFSPQATQVIQTHGFVPNK
jgi:phosphate transport system substrate-binding protein